MTKELLKELLDAGIHFGHRVSRWNPKMKPYIFGRRNMVHIIDIKETLKGLLRAKQFLKKTVADGGDVLFVGTKRQAKHSVSHHAQRCNMHYVSERWLGGTLTNFQTIRSRLARLEELERLEETGEIANYSKKMISTLQREKKKIKRNLEGIRRMDKLPSVLVIVDPAYEYIAVKEARKLGIPTVALIDTDGDPDPIDIIIPGNDDSMRAIDIVLRELADAVLEGLQSRPEETTVPEGEEKAIPADLAERRAKVGARRRPPRRRFSPTTHQSEESSAPTEETKPAETTLKPQAESIETTQSPDTPNIDTQVNSNTTNETQDENIKENG